MKFVTSLLIGFWGLGSSALAQEGPSVLLPDIREALTLHAAFDTQLHADFALGDPALYTVTAKEPERKTVQGLPPDLPDVVHEPEGGVFGRGYLSFVTGTAPTIYFRAKKNFAYSESDWEGTISFWLRTTPDEDLVEGYTDPIQITPRSALDACLFFEFGIEDPRPCRVGVFADTTSWNPEGKANRDIPLRHRPLITVTDPPFSRDRWTHVAITFLGFNNGDENGIARLYLDGLPRGDLMSWPQDYTWDLDKTEVRLGVRYVGGLDELSCFDRALTAEEIATLFALEQGVRELREKG